MLLTVFYVGLFALVTSFVTGTAFQRLFLKSKIVLGSALVASTLALTPSCHADMSSGIDLLELCPERSLSCVSSQDDRPDVFAEPWCYEGSFETARLLLLDKASQINGAKVMKNAINVGEQRFYKFEFENSDGSIDDTEFYFTPNDSTIQFRSNRRGNLIDFGANRNRLENLRINLRLEKVPVLRNRKNILFFFESPYDQFGPSSNEYGEPSDMKIDPIS